MPLAKEALPKTRFGRRSVGLIPGLVESMMALPSRLQGPDALVYQRGDGGYVNALRLHHACARVAKRAGLPPVHPHALRHTWATIMLSQGLPMQFVSRNLGHHSTSFTAVLYATAQPDPHLDEMDRAAELAMFEGELPEIELRDPVSNED